MTEQRYQLQWWHLWLLVLATFNRNVSFGQDDFQDRLDFQVRSAEDVIREWTPDRHVYVKGDLGLGKKQLQDLNTWLHTHGPHWTVVLMEQAQDERYNSPDGRRFSGLDAVEYAVAHGLANRTGFGKWEHPQTGETDGCVFVLFLKERKFSYYGSDAQDRRNCGESNWIGDLDREAFQAMRQGGRIVDAVKNTVKSINSRLELAIQREIQLEREAKEAEERAARERERAVQNAIERMDNIRNRQLVEFEEAVAGFRKHYPAASDSEMGRRSRENWDRELQDLAANLTVENVREQTQKIETLEAAVQRALTAYADHQHFSGQIDPWEKRWDTLAFHTGLDVAASEIKESRELLDQAKSQHTLGDSGFLDSFERATKAIEQGEALVLSALKQQEEREKGRRLIRQTLWVSAGMLGSLLMLILGLLNWRRRPSMVRAFAEFERRKTDETLEFAELEKIRLLQDATVASPALQGTLKPDGMTTQRLTELAAMRERVNHCFQEITRVSTTANQLLHPGIWGEFTNLFSSSRYQACINLLDGHSLDGSLVNIRHPVNGGHRVAFEHYLNHFRPLRENWQTAVQHLADGINRLPTQVSEARDSLNDLDKRIDQLNAQSRLDRKLAALALDQDLLPAIDQQLQLAAEERESDPVRVIEVILPRALQQLADAQGLCGLLETARNEMFPQLDQVAANLIAHDHRVDWIDSDVLDLGRRANELAEAATQTSQADQVVQLQKDLDSFRRRAQECARLAQEMDAHSTTARQALLEKLNAARQQIASQLSLDPSQVLVEEGYAPEQVATSIQRQLTAAQAALDRGQAETAGHALQAAAIEVERGQHLIDDSLQIAREFPQLLEQAQTRWSTTQSALEAAQQTLQATIQSFAPSAFRINRDDASHTADKLPAPGQILTVMDVVQDLTQSLTATRSTLDASPALFRSGRLLEVANHIDLAERETQGVAEGVQAVADHCQRLQVTLNENRSDAQRLLTGLRELQSPMADSRAESDTREDYQRTVQHAQGLVEDLNRPERRADPFADQQVLQDLQQHYQLLQQQVEADFRGYAEAVLAVKGALGELDFCEKLVQRATRDNIPDSKLISACLAKTEQFRLKIAKQAQALKSPHQIWLPIQTEAATSTAELGVIAGQLEQELALAEQAAQALQEASQAVYQASQWVGGWGVVIRRNFGSQELEMARDRLAEGNYRAATEESGRATAAAHHAIADANAELARQRAHRERQQRRQNSGSLFGGLGSGGSWSSGRSWSSGGSWSSGSRSSSSSSSRSSGGGSGFSRSGW